MITIKVGDIVLLASAFHTSEYISEIGPGLCIEEIADDFEPLVKIWWLNDGSEEETHESWLEKI